MKYSITTFITATILFVVFGYNSTYAQEAAFSVETGTTISASIPARGYLKLGGTSGLRLVMDTDEIQARNGTSEGALHLNSRGGSVFLGSSSTTTTNRGYLKLGNSGPAIKTKLIQATASGVVIGVSHGLTADRILSIDIISFEPSGGNAGNVYKIKDIISFDGSQIFIDGGIPSGASYRVYITYRQ